MTAVLTPRRRRYTALERKAMTAEQELELLTAEQAADDTHHVQTPGWQVSLDADGPDGGTVGSELIGRDLWDLVDSAIDLGLDPAELAYSGDLVDYLSDVGANALTDPRDTDHGTTNAYVNRKCRCPLCSAAWAQYMRGYRAARKAAA